MIKSISEEVLYGLYHVKHKRILGYNIRNNSRSSFSGDVTYTLDVFEDIEWLQKNPKLVEWTRQFGEFWYNSDFETPVNPYSKEDLIVIKVKIIKEMEEVEIKIPTLEEFYTKKYELDKKNQDFFLNAIMTGEIKDYSSHYLRDEEDF